MQPELKAVATRIREWQQARNISDAELCRRFVDLGSPKTFHLILDDKADGLDTDGRWQFDYERVWSLMEIMSTGDTETDLPLDDLTHVTQARLAVTDAMREPGNNRLVIIEGPTGSGKTTAARCIHARFGRKIIFCEADETWKESKSAMLGGILRALLPPRCSLPVGSEARLQKALDILTTTPVCLIIDEAHHLGPVTLNLVKTLLNQTKIQVVFCAVETLFRKLESSAYEEARQLTRNRLAERVKLGSVPTGDCAKFLNKRLTFTDGILPKLAKLLAERSNAYGHWNFIDLVVKKCRRLVGKETVDEETFVKALQQAAASR